MQLSKKVFLCLCMMISKSVFGVDSDEVKSVMEGDSVTLHTHLTDIQTDDQILWMFEPQGYLIAKIYKQANSSYIYEDDERFKGKLQLDDQTGSLTITNISITNSGLYKLTVMNNKSGNSYKKLNLAVYARLSVPVIIRNSSQCSSSSERSSVSKCVLLCSVMNVTLVSLSWYKGKSLLSSFSVSDLNISLSLPLEVEYQDTNTYRCVFNNPITNHTQHLYITDVCQPCSEFNSSSLKTAAAVVFSVVCMLGITAGVVNHCKRAPIQTQLQSYWNLLLENTGEIYMDAGWG
ncbi:SLAM family member 9-like isoform X2 [Triplophysa rosa]|uniref:SLAM family member 9-like isoform X2 n=1 Tax=Triplophysa rosa TaxID=992332 RepID=UPI00254627A8|nr:SLAM family member 9-like isoform X2 [Triplophysa rosa]